MTPSFFETWQQLQPVESWDTKQGVVHTASKGSLSAGEVITLTILVHEGYIVDACFLAYGNAMTLQCCSLLCTNLTRQPVSILQHFNKQKMAECLNLPRTQYHTLLLLEETIQMLARVF